MGDLSCHVWFLFKNAPPRLSVAEWMPRMIQGPLTTAWNDGLLSLVYHRVGGRSLFVILANTIYTLTKSMALWPLKVGVSLLGTVEVAGVKGSGC